MPEMNTSRKAMEWLICFPIVNFMLGRLLFKKFKKFNEIEYDELYPSGSAPARIYGTREMHKFSSSGLFPKLRPIISSIGILNYNLACFLCDLLSLLVPNDYSWKDTFSFVS